MKPAYSFRLDPELVKSARNLEIDLSAAIEHLLKELTDTETCLVCGTIVTGGQHGKRKAGSRKAIKKDGAAKVSHK